MSHSVFISYTYEEKSFKDKVASWIEGKRLGSDVVVTCERKDVRQHGEAEIRRHLEPLVRGCAAVLVLVGDDSHNRPWVDYEVAFAQAHGKVVIPVRIPGTTGALPKEIRGSSEVTFEPSAIANALSARLR